MVFDRQIGLLLSPVWHRYREIRVAPGNRYRPRRYDRRLLRVFDMSAQLSARSNPEFTAYYDRKRLEGSVTPRADDQRQQFGSSTTRSASRASPCARW